MMSYNTVFTQKAQLEVCIISSSGGHYCPHHPTGRQAPLKVKGSASPVRRCRENGTL